MGRIARNAQFKPEAKAFKANKAKEEMNAAIADLKEARIATYELQKMMLEQIESFGDQANKIFNEINSKAELPVYVEPDIKLIKPRNKSLFRRLWEFIKRLG